MTTKRILSAITLVAATLLSASCSHPPRETWAMVQNRGLIYTFRHYQGHPASDFPAGSMVAEEGDAADGAAGSDAGAGGFAAAPSGDIATGLPADGRPGLAMTPYTNPPRLVDVREFTPGEQARCPYTGRIFLVPGAPASAPSGSAAIASTDAVDPKPEGEPDPKTVPTVPPSDADPKVAAGSDPDAGAGGSVAADAGDAPASPPFGARIAGRPGFANSPFAEKNQIVNIKGIKPGTVVRCPYSGKLFRVPPLLADDGPETSVGTSEF